MIVLIENAHSIMILYSKHKIVAKPWAKNCNLNSIFTLFYSFFTKILLHFIYVSFYIILQEYYEFQ